MSASGPVIYDTRPEDSFDERPTGLNQGSNSSGYLVAISVDGLGCVLCLVPPVRARPGSPGGHRVFGLTHVGSTTHHLLFHHRTDLAR